MSSPALTTAMDKQYGYTEVETQHFTYEWRIKNFGLLPQENAQCIFSPIFRVKENDEVTWKLQLFPHGQEKDDADSVSLFLNLNSQDAVKTKIKVQCELSISNSKGINSTMAFTYTYKVLEGYGFPKMIARSVLLNSCDRDDSITLRCKMTIGQRTITKSFDPVSLDSQKPRLSKDFAMLYKNLQFCDVTIIVGDEKFTAHKVVLAARSTVFAAMFEHKEMEENRKNEVKIEDLEPGTVRGMLEFIYTDKVTDLESLAHGLLRASDKYDLRRLKWICEEFIHKTLTSDNAAEILVLSDLYHSDKLKEHVMAFIDGHLSSVVYSESFKNMVGTHSALFGELMSSVAARRESKT